MTRVFIIQFILLLQPVCLRAITVLGIVKDENGKGLHGVNVSIEGLLQAPVITDGSGDFRIEIESSLYTPGVPIVFQINKKEYEPESPNLLRQYVPNPNIPNSHIVLVMRKVETTNKIKLSGFVETEKNHPVGGVTITIYETGQTIQSDTNGRFTLFLSKKLLNTDITFRTVRANYVSDPKSYTVTISPKPLLLRMKSEPNNQATSPVNSPFLLPTITPGSKNSYLNFFIKEGDPTQWVERAKLYRLVSSDINNNRSGDETNSFQLQRHYSSGDNNILGIFGYGWHHTYESRILLEKSTLSTIVYMHFDGTRLYFRPALDVNTIMKSVRLLMPDVNERTTLEAIIQYEIDKGKNILGTLNNLLFIGNDISVSQLKILPRGFQFRKDKDSYFIYDKEGRLESLEQKGTKPLRIIYNIDGNIEGVTNRTTTTKFNYDNFGLISSLSYDDTLKVYFAYDTEKRLSQISKNDRAIYSYKYDSNNRMIFFYDLQGKDTTIILYDQAGNKVSKQNNQLKVTWAYKDNIDTLEVTQMISYYSDEDGTRNEDGHGRRHIEYKFAKKSKELYMKEQDRGLKIYKIAACGCSTLEVRKNYDTIRYEYNYLGYVTKVEGERTTKKLSYNMDVLKLDTLSIYDAYSNEMVYQAVFFYDADGNLVKASNKKGILVMLGYNEKNLVSEMIVKRADTSEPRTTTILYKYNERGKPVTIGVKGRGNIYVTYNDTGDVEKVDSDGDNIALAITQSFQDFSELLRPASVEVDTGYITINL